METHEPIDLIRTGAIEPWQKLSSTLAEQKAVEAANSDEGREAGRLAMEVIRLADSFGLDNRDLGRRSNYWALVSAVADAGRNRLLSSAARRTTLAATSHFEVDDKGHYRFINNHLMIVHPTAGKVDFLTAAAGAIGFLIDELGDELGIEIDWTPQIVEGPPVFGPAVILDAGPDPNRVFQSLQIKFYKRDADGELVMFQPGSWQLELKSSGNEKG